MIPQRQTGATQSPRRSLHSPQVTLTPCNRSRQHPSPSALVVSCAFARARARARSNPRPDWFTYQARAGWARALLLSTDTSCRTTDDHKLMKRGVLICFGNARCSTDVLRFHSLLPLSFSLCFLSPPPLSLCLSVSLSPLGVLNLTGAPVCCV